VLEFDDNDVDCETDDEIVVFVRVDDAVDESVCEVVGVEFDEGELEIGEKFVVEEVRVDVSVGVMIGVFGGSDVGVEIEVGEVESSGISKISTTSEYLLALCPPPKNILFIDDVDANQ
jgi:hypothetical protein